MKTVRSLIQVQHLTARYGKRTVLDNISFEINDGEIFVILGGSGCGKSTLLRHMIGLDNPFRGQVKIDGIDITTCNDKEFQVTLRKIGVLFQSSALFGSMTVAENVGLPLAEFSRLSPDAISHLVRMKLHMVGLDGFQNFLPSELSGGMKKRAGLARALALNPKILFLDEPSAGLDPVTSAEIDELILNINAIIGTTIIIVTHELDSIFKLAQRVIMLDKETRGIIAEGDPNELKKHSQLPAVKRFFNRQGSANIS